MVIDYYEGSCPVALNAGSGAGLQLEQLNQLAPFAGGRQNLQFALRISKKQACGGGVEQFD